MRDRWLPGRTKTENESRDGKKVKDRGLVVAKWHGKGRDESAQYREGHCNLERRAAPDAIANVAEGELTKDCPN